MVNTSNAVSTTQTPGVLRTGEKVATALSSLQSKDAKTFYHQIHGARFIMPDGLELVFLGGQFTTDEPSIISELSKVADRGTSMIYSRKPGALAEAIAKDAEAVKSAIQDTSANSGKADA